jgi:hypothetical protein
MPRSWGRRRLRHQSILNANNAALIINHNKLICWELGEPR